MHKLEKILIILMCDENFIIDVKLLIINKDFIFLVVYLHF
jgi:hypothetical protein